MKDDKNSSSMNDEENIEITLSMCEVKKENNDQEDPTHVSTSEGDSNSDDDEHRLEKIEQGELPKEQQVVVFDKICDGSAMANSNYNLNNGTSTTRPSRRCGCCCGICWCILISILVSAVVFTAVVVGVIVATTTEGSKPSVATSMPPPVCSLDQSTNSTSTTKWFQSNVEVLQAVCWLGIPRSEVDWYHVALGETIDPCAYFLTPDTLKETKRQEVLDTYGPIEDWRFESTVTSLSQLFRRASSFNADIRCWNVDSVKDFSSLLNGASSFRFDLNGWNVSSGTNFGYMFAGADSYNFHLSSWNMSSATTLVGMFEFADSFNGDISTWDTSSVTNMAYMFWFAKKFDQNVTKWDVSSVVNFERMFSGAYRFRQDITGWDVSSGRNFRSMFSYAESFNQDISVWQFNPSFSRILSVNVDEMFYWAESFNQNLCAWRDQAVSFQGNNVFERSSCPDLSSPVDTDGGTDTSNGNTAWCHPCGL